MRPLALAITLLSLFSTPVPAATLDDEVSAFLQVIAVSGRESAAADFIASRLAAALRSPR